MNYKTDKWESACVKVKYLHIHVWHYSPFWAQASLKKRLRSYLSPVCLLQSRIPRICNTFLCDEYLLLVLGFPNYFFSWNFPLRTPFFWGGGDSFTSRSYGVTHLSQSSNYNVNLSSSISVKTMNFAVLSRIPALFLFCWVIYFS